MQKNLDQLLNELSMIERDPIQKQHSFQRLSKRIQEQYPVRKRLNNWKPVVVIVMLVLVCSLYVLTYSSDSPIQNQNAVRADKMIDLLGSDDIYINSMNISTSHLLKYTPTGNPTYYFGFEEGIVPLSNTIYNTEHFLSTAKPIGNVDLKTQKISIRDVQVKYYNSNSESDGISFLKFVFLDSTNDLLYVKEINNNQWYKIQGDPAEKLQKLKYTTNSLNSGASILSFYTGIYILSFLIGAVIKDKFPIIKRTPLYIDKKHKRIDRSISFGFFLIIVGLLYYFGVVHIAWLMILSFIVLGFRLYMELKYRPETKRHYLIINQIIQTILFLIGFLWIF